MKKTLAILTMLLIASTPIFAQEKSFFRTVRASFTTPWLATDIPTQAYIGHGWDWTPSYTLDADLWQLNARFSLGLHLAFNGAGMTNDPALGQLPYSEIESSLGVHYGADLRYHLPLQSTRWGLTLGASLGSYFAGGLAPQIEYGASFAATYYPFAHWGIFAEAGWGRYLAGKHLQS